MIDKIKAEIEELEKMEKLKGFPDMLIAYDRCLDWAIQTRDKLISKYWDFDGIVKTIRKAFGEEAGK